MRILFAALIAALCTVSIGTARAADVAFEFSLDKASTVSAGIYDADGKLVRTLWSLKECPAGKQTATWDGLDDMGRNLPAGKYEVRLAVGNAEYSSVGVIGNNGIGTTMQAACDDIRVDPRDANIYTANVWEEAGQDFKREAPDGTTVVNSQFRARSTWGNAPGGMPVSIAVDDTYVYTGIYTGRDYYQDAPGTSPGGQIIRKFTKDKAENVKFTETGECIRVHYPDPKWESPWGHESLRSIVVLGDTLIVGDKFFDRVLKYDKNSGKLLGQFEVKLPQSIALDAENRLWIAHDTNKVTVFDVAGKQLAQPSLLAEAIDCMRLDGKGNLWLADPVAKKIQVYKIEGLDKLTLQRSYGRKPEGEPHPNDIYKNISFDVMPDGGYVIVQSPGHGCIEARFDADGNQIWQQVGLEFCTNGTYDLAKPDMFVSSLLNAYTLMDRQKGEWKFSGNISSNENFTGFQSAGRPRFIKLGNKTFYYISTGEKVMIFRSESGRLIPAMQLGFGSRSWNEKALGKLPKDEQNIWFTWADANGDGAMQAEEVTKQKPAFNFRSFSIDVAENGDLTLPNHYTKSVFELPLAGLDKNGLPIYKFESAHEVLPADSTFRGLQPMEALRTPEGNYYVLSRADASFYPTTGLSGGWEYCWMGGWAISKYDQSGKCLFTLALPDLCTGFDWVPNADRTGERGFIAGQFTAKNLYHYSKDGLLLGKLHPAHTSGWLDHNGSMSINRNPKDGIADVFAEESLCNRISWYRMDDADIKTLSVSVTKPAVANEAASSEAEMYAAIEAGKAKEAARDFSGAADDYKKALDMATPIEKPFIRLVLGKALLATQDRKAEGIEQMKLAAATESMDPKKRADLLMDVARQQMYMREYDASLATLKEAESVPVPKNYRYDYKLTIEAGRVCLAAGRYDDALAMAEKAMKQHPDHDGDGQYFAAYWLKGDAFIRTKRYDDALALYKSIREFRIPRVDHLTEVENRIADVYLASGDAAKAAEVRMAALKKYPQMPMYMKPGFMLRTADNFQQAGDTQKALDYCRQVIALDGSPQWAINEANNRIEKWTNN